MIVPKFFGSPWQNKHRASLTTADLEWPRIGIYCPHDPLPWLLGSFELSDGDDPWWGWTDAFATGDGHLIRLGSKAPRVHLVDDQVWDRDQAKVDNGKATDAMLRGDLETAMRITERISRAEAAMRTNHPLKCKQSLGPTWRKCPEKVDLSSATAQPILQRLWDQGVRELSLPLLRVAIRASTAGRR